MAANWPFQRAMLSQGSVSRVGAGVVTQRSMASGSSRDSTGRWVELPISMARLSTGMTSVRRSRFLYACPNVTTRYKIVPLDVSTPTWMRGPGEATGSFALESAMDELSYALHLDPLELRLRNHADTDPERNLP